MKTLPKKEDLINLYINENKSVKEIATYYEVSVPTVCRWLKGYEIKKTKEQRLMNVSRTMQNRSEEEKLIYKQHLSSARKGKGIGIVPWNKGLIGAQIAWNRGLHTKGHPRTAESLEKARQTCLEKYGVDWACQRQEARLKGQNSAANLEFETVLKDNNITYTREFPIGAYSYDFKVNKYLIEIDPFATHNSTWGIRDNTPKATNYHKSKSDLAAANGYFCIHIFDWDDKYKIINKFILKREICAEECVIKELTVEVAKEFLCQYHPQNYTNSTNRFGLFYNDELVEVMTFCRPRYNKQCEWELSRVCAKPEYHVLGGCKRLLEAFKAKIRPTSIVVYCDLAKLDGNLYKNLGFSQLKSAKPTRHWYNPKTKTHITDAFLWSKGFDRLFGTNYGKQASNTQLMLEHGFVEIYDCGQATFIWNK